LHVRGAKSHVLQAQMCILESRYSSRNLIILFLGELDTCPSNLKFKSYDM
jgi:hypothetical protein